MKVEANLNVNHQKVTENQANIEEYQAMIVLKLLGKVAKDLLADVKEYQLAVAQETSNKPQKGSKGNLSTSKKPDVNNSAPSSESGEDAILAAFIDELTTNQAVKALSRDSIDSAMNEVLSQLESVQDLQADIQELQNQLKKNLSPALIQEVTQELKALQTEYDQALASYNSACNDYTKNQQAVANAQNDYNQAKEAYDKMKNKSSPEAKKLKQEMDQDKKTIKSALLQMDNDAVIISKSKNVMNLVLVQVSAFIKKHPALSSILGPIVSEMQSYASIDSDCGKVTQQLQDMQKQDQQLLSSINEKEKQLQAVIEDLSHGSDSVERAIEQYAACSQQIDSKILGQLVQNLFNHQINHRENQQEVRDSLELRANQTHHTVSTRHEIPEYRHQIQSEIHEKK